jgi:hypothetical protein
VVAGHTDPTPSHQTLNWGCRRRVWKALQGDCLTVLVDQKMKIPKILDELQAFQSTHFNYQSLTRTSNLQAAGVEGPAGRLTVLHSPFRVLHGHTDPTPSTQSLNRVCRLRVWKALQGDCVTVLGHTGCLATRNPHPFVYMYIYIYIYIY